VNIYNDKSLFGDTTIIYPVGMEINMDAYGFVKIYPNPATSFLHIQLLKEITTLDISIYSIEGKMVFSNSYHSDHIVIPLNGMKQGIYFIQVSTNEKTVRTKFILGSN
jgi:hypothetical protein